MDPLEAKLVRQYAINEIAGGLVLGHFLLQSEDPVIRSQLTYHAMDELKHGWLWTDLLNKKGIGVAGAKGDNAYFRFMAAQQEELAFLAAAHVYELRIPFHLGAHMRLPQIDPELKKVMGDILNDEQSHLGWIRDYLVKKMDTNAQQVIDAIKACETIEQETYTQYIGHIKQYGGYLGDLAALIEKKMPEFPAPSTYFTHLAQHA